MPEVPMTHTSEPSSAPVLPWADPWSAAGGPHGVLVVHGFTGNPQSMRALAEGFAAAGFAVELPLLPGHGTSVDDMLRTRFTDWSAAAEEAYLELAGRCDEVVVAGLSMGATLAAWLTVRHPAIAGLVVVNGMFDPPDESFVQSMRQLLEQGTDRIPAIGSDIADPEVVELAYEATPVAPLLSFLEAVGELRPSLSEIRCPVLVLTSPQDHVVPPVSSEVLAGAVAGPVERVELERSYHVATLDYDRDVVVERAVAFALRAAARRA
jgi:carboxylesterase